MTQNLRTALLLAFGCLFILAGAAAAETGVIHSRLSSGVNVTVYSADYLSQKVRSTSESRGVVEFEDGTALNLVTDIGDDLIHNKGDGSFHRFEVRDVLDALRDIDLPGLALDVEVVVLPFPRAEILVSSATRNRIFLSPQVTEISKANAAYVVSHEVGHVFQGRYFPELGEAAGEAYRRMRGIDDAERFHPYAAHPDRPGEIFAEDFRVLFGGALARFDGHVENTEISPPAQVPGLPEFFRSLVRGPAVGPIVSVSSYPNPFNPSTELKVELDPNLARRGDEVAVRIYDVRGALVRNLLAGEATSSEIRVRWDGLDQRGRQVASAVYFGVIDFGGERKTQKLMLVK